MESNTPSELLKSDPLEMYVVYERPKDYPTEYVIRRWIITSMGPVAAEVYFKDGSISKCRQIMINHGLARISRQPDDDPVIVETWL